MADPYNGTVHKVASNGGPQSTVGAGLQFPTGVAVTQDCDVFIADFNQSRVFRVDADTGSQTAIANRLWAPYSLALGPDRREVATGGK
ncbi:hypothetical protein EBF04_29940 [Streptomyces sp. I6]|nr:hypothetical protein EBF04_29940 [Streptomyces sp. I6]